MRHTKEKHGRLYGLLNKKQMMEQRHELFQSYSKNRTRDSKDLSEQEMDDLIRFLEFYNVGGMQSGCKTDFEKGDKMRKRVLSLCYEYGWTRHDAVKNKRVVDYAKLNAWLLKSGYLHKSLNQYKYAELPKLVTQFENVIKSFLKAV